MAPRRTYGSWRMILWLVWIIILAGVMCDGDMDNRVDMESNKESKVANKVDRANVVKKKFILESIKADLGILREELLARGWIEQTRKTSASYDFKWTWSAARIGSIGRQSKQIVNHFRNNDEIGTKEGLVYNLRRWQADHPEDDIYAFFPRAYILDSSLEADWPHNLLEFEAFKRDWRRTKEASHRDEITEAPPEIEAVSGESDAKLVNDNGEKSGEKYVSNKVEESADGHCNNGECLQEEDEQSPDQYSSTNSTRYEIELPPLQSIDGHKNLWIAKPSSGARGVGIKLFDDMEELLQFVNGSNFVVQKYMEDPLLIQNKKFDIRQFVLVTGLDPLTIFIFEDCYLRFCTKEYNTGNIEDIYVHLTNHQVQKNSEFYHNSTIKANQWSLKMFKDYLGSELGKPDAWETLIKPKIEDLVVKSLKTWPKIGHRDYSFELLGYDIMLDKKLSPYLIEININPGLHLLTEIVIPHHTKLQRDLMKVVIDHRQQWASLPGGDPEKIKELNEKKLYGDWKLLFKDKTVNKKKKKKKLITRVKWEGSLMEEAEESKVLEVEKDRT